MSDVSIDESDRPAKAAKLTEPSEDIFGSV